ncbi:hypothetical protein [Agromyces binzhouensis]|uniref:hypothetical protein n=1 Tax=Agromyces binzhouensis TaxID=1817495 RepID=UPI00363B8CE2
MTRNRPLVGATIVAAFSLTLTSCASALATDQLTQTPIEAAPERAECTPSGTAGDGIYQFGGNVRIGDDERIAGAAVSVSNGSGFAVVTCTDADGSWSINVPSKEASYAVALDPRTLPPELHDLGLGEFTQVAEFGLTDRKAVNFFLPAE